MSRVAKIATAYSHTRRKLAVAVLVTAMLLKKSRLYTMNDLQRGKIEREGTKTTTSTVHFYFSSGNYTV